MNQEMATGQFHRDALGAPLSLALKTLLYEWRRYTAAVIALALSGVLILTVAGLVLGIGKAATAVIDKSPADLIILGAKSESLFESGSGVSRRNMPSIYLHPEVVSVQEIKMGGGEFKNRPKNGGVNRSVQAQMLAVDPYPDSYTLPKDFPENARQALLEPFSIVVDKSALKSMGVKVGDEGTMNGRTVRVAAVIEGQPNVLFTTMYTSRDTLRLLGMAREGNRVGPLLIRLRNTENAELVRDQLNAVAGKEYKAWLPADLSRANEKSMMANQIMGLVLGFMAFIGGAIGIGITWQTLSGAILANIKEFASLRALGVPMMALRIIVLEMSFWVGVIGTGSSVLVISLIGAAASSFGVPMKFPLWTLAGLMVLLVTIAMASGLLSLGILKKSQPADLLR